MDGFINANPLGKRLFAVYKPIQKPSINFSAGIIIDLVYGFLLAGIFLVLFDSLPGDTGFLKGLSFASLLWFCRIIMSVLSNWMMYSIPIISLLYSLFTGLGEMLVLGILYGLLLAPWY
jgi:hypothetical protein